MRWSRPVLLMLALVVPLVVSCFQTDTVPAAVTYDDVVAARDEVNAVAPLLDQIVDMAWADPNGVDTASVAATIEALPDVRSTRLTETGTTVIATMSGGTVVTIPLLRMNNEDAFVPVMEADAVLEAADGGASAIDTSGVFSSEFPTGNRALILGPVRSEFGVLRWNPADQERVLTNAGFDVDAFYDADATIDKFTGEFLSQYDVVMIYTHGAVGSGWSNVDSVTTTLLTGTAASTVDAELVSELGDAVQSLAFMPYAFKGKGKTTETFLAVTPEFIRATATSGFERRTYILAIACESAKLDLGAGSLAHTVIDLGAGGFSGYTETQNIRLASSQSTFLLTRLGSGDSLATATDAARSDTGLTLLSWVAKVTNLDLSISAELLYSTQRRPDPYYIVPPDTITASATTIPSYGPPGTPVTFESVVRESRRNLVETAVLEIDNTGERIDLEETSPGIWVPTTGLRAPIADAYPRLDTFTFRGFSDLGVEQARGITYFTITTPETTPSGTAGAVDKRRWVNTP